MWICLWAAVIFGNGSVSSLGVIALPQSFKTHAACEAAATILRPRMADWFRDYARVDFGGKVFVSHQCKPNGPKV